MVRIWTVLRRGRSWSASVLKVICVASAKGGAGKSTLALNLAALAAETGEPTLIVDLDPQASAVDWRKVRTAEAPWPRVAAGDVETLPALLAAARGEGIGLVVLDTPPQNTRKMFAAIELANLTIVPIRPSVLDIRSAGRTLRKLRAYRRRYAVVLNACPITSRGEARAVRESREALAPHPILPFCISQRVAFQHALIDGRAAHEYEPEGKAAAEMRSVVEWARRTLATA